MFEDPDLEEESYNAEAYPANRHPRKSHQNSPYGRKENENPKKSVEKTKQKKVIKMEPPPLVQAAKQYSISEDLLNTKANITFAQLLQSPQIRKELKKSITPRRKGAKHVHFGKSVNIPKGATFTPLICKAQVYGWTIDLIVDSGSSISVISENFMKDIGHHPTKTSTRTVSDIHGEKKLPIGIVENIQVAIEGVKATVDMDVINASDYAIIVGTDWLTKVKAKIE